MSFALQVGPAGHFRGIEAMRSQFLIICATLAFASTRSARAQPCQPFWQPLNGGVNGFVDTLLVFDDDGAGPRPTSLFLGGGFTLADGLNAQRVARWDGQTYSALSTGFNNEVGALVAFDEDGPGPLEPALFAGGRFTLADGITARRIARWNGTSWSPVGSGIGPFGDSTVGSLAVFDEDGVGPNSPALFVGGSFEEAGGTPAENIARWNGQIWSAVGGGANGAVTELYVHDEDGAGPLPPALFVGGAFFAAGGVSANCLARWDGSHWSEVGGGVNFFVDAMVTWDDDGPGPNPPALFVGGNFTVVGGNVPISYVAKWDGQNWSDVGGGTDSNILSLAVFDEDGAGSELPKLFAAGQFTMAGGVAANQIARWDGVHWSNVGDGTNSTTYALHAGDLDGAGGTPPTLYVSGNFDAAGGVPAGRIAAWVGYNTDCIGDVNFDGVIDLTDLATLLSNFGSAPAKPIEGDLDDDDDVDLSDLAVLLSNFGIACE